MILSLNITIGVFLKIFSYLLGEKFVFDFLQLLNASLCDFFLFDPYRLVDGGILKGRNRLNRLEKCLYGGR